MQATNTTTRNHDTWQLIMQQRSDASEVMRAQLYRADTPQRETIEQFIERVFAQHYQAHIQHFYPNLLSSQNPQGHTLAAVGFRQGSEQAFFLEQYLQLPIETMLSNYAGSISQRHDIVEIGNLATTIPGSCLRLFQLLSLYFHSSQLHWVIFTGTRTVRAVLKRLRLQAFTLNPASADAVNNRASWGSYYQQQPMVMAMPVNQGIERITQRYQLQYVPLQQPQAA